MKKIILAALLCMSANAFATETNSVRTPSGDLVSVGDSESSITQKLGQSKPSYYVLKDSKHHCAATEYAYDINYERYRVIACRGQVVKIEWERR